MMALTYVSAFFHRVSPAVVALDIQASFGVSAGLIGLMASAYFYSYSFIQFPAGLLSDSLGPRKSVTLFLLIGAAGSFLFGAAPNWEWAVVGRVLVGLGAGMAFTPTMKILSTWFRVNEFTRMAGALLFMGGVGALTAAAPLAFIAGLMGWRAAFQVIGVGTVLLALVVWLVVRDKPEDRGWPSLAEIDPVYGRTLKPPAGIGLAEGAKKVLCEKYFWPPAVWGVCVMGSFFAFAGLWAGPYLMHVYGMSRTEAGGVLNMTAVGIALGSPLMGYISDRVLRSRKRLLMWSSVCFVATMLFMNLVPSGLPRFALYPLFLIFSVCSLAPGVVFIAAGKELFPLEMTGTSVGTINLFPFLGGALLQALLGRLLDSYPALPSGAYSLTAYCSMLNILGVLALVGLFCTFFIKETFPGAEPAGTE